MAYKIYEDDTDFSDLYNELQTGDGTSLNMLNNARLGSAILPGYAEAQRNFAYGLFNSANNNASVPVALPDWGAIDDDAELVRSNFLRSEKSGYETNAFDKRDLSRSGDTMTALFRKNYGYTPSAGELIQYANLNGMDSPHELDANTIINSPSTDRLHQLDVSSDQIQDYCAKNAKAFLKRTKAAQSDPLTNGELWKASQAERDADPNYVKAKIAEQSRNYSKLDDIGHQYNLSKGKPYFPIYLSGNLAGFDDQVISNTQKMPVSAPSSPQTAGQGLVGIWDALQRDQYKKAIAENANKSVALVKAATLANDIEAANAAAYNASDARSKIRLETREKLSWGGARMSDMIDKSLTPEQYFDKCRPKHSDPFDLAKTVAEKSGSSRGSIKYLQMFGKTGGVVGTGLGLYTAGKNVYDAPEPLKGQVVAQETGGILGGAGGSALGTGLGVLGVGALAATPPGWVAISGGILGGAIGGYLGSENGKYFGGKVYRWLKK
ncbi:hypothetical protein ACO0LF_19415 [Undibacterium sp. Di27W]|uniref:hypothetical protein n=1 Tax=Undibacterium sp. Di27W TaxID=3413036 RepID=UPI003BF4570D